MNRTTSRKPFLNTSRAPFSAQSEPKASKIRKKKCFAGFTVSGDNVGVDESVTVSGEALSFLSTGIDTRVYFIKNF